MTAEQTAAQWAAGEMAGADELLMSAEDLLMSDQVLARRFQDRAPCDAPWRPAMQHGTTRP